MLAYLAVAGSYGDTFFKGVTVILRGFGGGGHGDRRPVAASTKPDHAGEAPAGTMEPTVSALAGERRPRIGTYKIAMATNHMTKVS